MRAIALVIATLTLPAAFGQTLQKGTISGTVVDDQGRPVAGVKVAAFEVAGAQPKGFIGVIPWKMSDSAGKWQITGLEAGTYLLGTEDKAAGYPNTMTSFYKPNPQIVSLTADSPMTNVVIQLGPRAGVLTGSITDAVTGAPIPNGGVELWRTEDAKHSMNGRSIEAQYKILLPANAAVSMKFTAPGYQTSYYPGVAQASNSTSLTLKSGQQQTMDVQLQPLP